MVGCAGAVVGVLLIVLLWWWLSPPKHAFSLGFGRSFGEAEVFCQTVPAPPSARWLPLRLSKPSELRRNHEAPYRASHCACKRGAGSPRG